MLENLSGRLASVVKSLRGQARITEANVQDTLRQVRLALLEADVALPVVKDFIEAVKTRGTNWVPRYASSNKVNPVIVQ